LRYHNGPHILSLKSNVPSIYPEPLQHSDQTLFGKSGVCRVVARCIQANNKAIAKQWIVSNAFKIDNIFDPGGSGCRRMGRYTHKQGGKNTPPKKRGVARFVRLRSVLAFWELKYILNICIHAMVIHVSICEKRANQADS
jgi:hypothetical protein